MKPPATFPIETVVNTDSASGNRVRGLRRSPVGSTRRRSVNALAVSWAVLLTLFAALVIAVVILSGSSAGLGMIHSDFITARAEPTRTQSPAATETATAPPVVPSAETPPAPTESVAPPPSKTAPQHNSSTSTRATQGAKVWIPPNGPPPLLRWLRHLRDRLVAGP